MMTGTEGYTGSMEPATFQIFYDSRSLGYVSSTTRISFSGDNGASFVMNETMVITNSTVFNAFSERMMASPSVSIVIHSPFFTLQPFTISSSSYQ
jgi:hypothetical protein